MFLFLFIFNCHVALSKETQQISIKQEIVEDKKNDNSFKDAPPPAAVLKPKERN